jgi:uncharacterized membrane protein YphA (DoxX/SURF4 family)
MSTVPATPLQRLNKFLSHSAVQLAIRLVVGGVFFLFGLAKALAPPEEFFAIIRTYDLLPPALVPAVGTVMMYTEIALGLLLIVGLFTRQAAWGIAGLLVIFLVAIGQAIARSIPLTDCGCSGGWIKIGDTPADVFWRDIVMLAGIAWLLTRRQLGWGLDQLFRTKPTLTKTIETDHVQTDHRP